MRSRRSSRRRSGSPAPSSFGRWRASMCARRRRPRRFSSSTAATFPISSRATNTPRRCRGWRMSRGSSGHGSMPITPPMRSRSRQRCSARSPRNELADTVLTPHPATRIVRSRFPAVSIFTANRSDGSGRPDRNERRRGRAGHQARSRGRRSLASARRRDLSRPACRGGTARRRPRMRLSQTCPQFDLSGAHRRTARRGRLHIGSMEELMTMAHESEAAIGRGRHGLGGLVERIKR